MTLIVVNCEFVLSAKIRTQYTHSCNEMIVNMCGAMATVFSASDFQQHSKMCKHQCFDLPLFHLLHQNFNGSLNELVWLKMQHTLFTISQPTVGYPYCVSIGADYELHTQAQASHHPGR